MSGFKLNTASLLEGLISTPDKFDVAVRMFADTHAKTLEKDAKENAKWTDRTSHARQRMKSYVETTGSGYRIVLAHGVDYGLWLELANEKRFAIVEPTVRLSSPYIMKDFQGLLNKIGRK